jgi:hypothetical protein
LAAANEFTGAGVENFNDVSAEGAFVHLVFLGHGFLLFADGVIGAG